MPDGETVRLTFTSFDLVPEACGDFVQVYDYNQASPQLAGKHGTNYKQNSTVLLYIPKCFHSSVVFTSKLDM